MQDDFRRVMAQFVTGVTVMTTRAGEAPHGMTANAVASVSLDPLLVLVCVDRTTHMARMVRESGVFALSILAADQEGLSNRFADRDRPMGAAQFAGVPTATGTTGALVLAESLAWVDCRVWAIHDGGDHEIVVGEVVDLDVGRDVPPLGYFRSAYVPVGEG